MTLSPALVVLLATAASPAPPDDGAGRRAAAVSVAAVVGPVAHGAGHFVRGETRTAWRLLAMQAAGVVGVVGGIGALALTGASDDTIAPVVLTSVHGFGLFAISWLADVYGSVSSGDGAGRPVTRPPWLAVELGHRFVHDPVFEYGHLGVLGLEGRWRAGTLEARGWFALDDDNQRVRVRPAWRLLGPRPDRPSADGSALDLRLGGVWHRYGTERFSMTTGEAALAGRLDLARVGRTLRGAFAEAEGGFAAGVTAIEGIDAEPTELLLARFGFGLYLGHAGDGYGEVAAYYDHRHDGYVAGLKLAGLGSGMMGHYGVRASVSLWGPWGVAALAEVGSAWLGGLSLTHRSRGGR